MAGLTATAAFLLIAFMSGCAELPTEGVDGSNTAPVAEIIAPAPEPGNGNSDMAPVRYSKGEQILFDGYGYDAEEDTLGGNSINWTSNRDGVIGTGRTFYRADLSNGAHLIKLTVIDGNGETGRDSVRVVIQGGNNDHPRDDGLVVEIQSRARGLHFFEGEEILLQGTASDESGGELTGSSLVWSSDLDGELGTGEEIDLTGRLSLGNHKITLTATDSEGFSGSDQIRLILTRAPGPRDGDSNVEILSPGRGNHFFVDEEIILKGIARDEQGEELADSALHWSSDLDGELGSGRELDVTGRLSIGKHAITLTATDSVGEIGKDQIRLNITRAPGPPGRDSDVTITSPSKGNHFFAGDEIILKGTATDENGDTLSGSFLQWSSDLDGELGTGSELDVTGMLAIGNHIITLTATDGSNVFGSDSRRIIITRSRGGGR